MLNNLSERDRRAVFLMIVGAAVILGYFLVFEPVMQNYQKVNEELARQRSRFETLLSFEQVSKKQRNLNAMVPVYKLPNPAKEQGVSFRDEFTGQLNKAGIKAKSVELDDRSRKRRVDGYRVLLVECQAKCSYGQILTLLDSLKKNPKFVAVEELKLKVDPKKRSTMDMTLVVSTFGK